MIATYRHRQLLHGFEQRGLGLRRGAVDLVGEDQVRDQRSLLELHLVPAILALDQDRSALDVRRHHVRRELDAGEVQIERLTEAAHEQGLAQPGDTLEQNVAAREQCGENSLYDVDLADVVIGTGEAVPASIPAAGVITIYGKSASPPVNQAPQVSAGSDQVLTLP